MKFLFDSKLNSAIEDLIKDAKDKLIIVSPFIKLSPRVKGYLKDKLKKDSLHILVVFGKNNYNHEKSLSEEDLRFLLEFPNIEIKYEERLHAKYYANDYTSIFSSMNLLEYSINNNIEFGIQMETNGKNLLGKLSYQVGESIDQIGNMVLRADEGDDPVDYFNNMIAKALLVYRKGPFYASAWGGISRKYVESKEVENNIHLYYKRNPEKPATVSSKPGFCIRTGVQIPFNQERPFSAEGYKLWAKTKLEEGPEFYCHFSGERSEGQTSKAKPILRKNWKKTMGK